jgi:anti-sigma B factor antagonist
MSREAVMPLSERHVDGVAILDVSGDLRLAGGTITSALREQVRALLKRGERRILLNVANLQHVDSAFVGELVASYKATLSSGGLLRLEHVGPTLHNVLQTTTLDTLLKAYGDEGEAIASFAELV